MADTTGTQIDVMFPNGRSPIRWEESYERGEVPGRWPYGLDELRRPGIRVQAVEMSAPSRLERVLAKVGSGFRSTVRPQRERSGRSAITWDENAARQMAVSTSGAAMYSGVIWLTDRIRKAPNGDNRGWKVLLNQMSGLWVLSSAQLQPLMDFVGPGGPTVHHVPFGVDSKFFLAQPYPERPMVFSAGGDRDRDALTLFAAMRIIRSQCPDAELIVQSTSHLDPPEGVQKLHHLSHPELRAMYGRASVVVIATRPNLHFSGMTVTLESMATARPVVLTGTPGVADYIVDGVDGYLTPVGDPRRLADRTVELLRDEATAQSIGRVARGVIENRFTTTHMSESIAKLATIGN